MSQQELVVSAARSEGRMYQQPRWRLVVFAVERVRIKIQAIVIIRRHVSDVCFETGLHVLHWVGSGR